VSGDNRNIRSEASSTETSEPATLSADGAWIHASRRAVAAVLANAAYHATGKRVRDLPITLDKLL
jgi:hypothetical protein